MDVKDLISKLEKDASGMEKEAMVLLEKRKNYIIGAVKRRLFEVGINGDGTPKYSKDTIRKKRKKGQRSSHVTLNWTGKFWDNYDVRFEGSKLVLFNKDKDGKKVGRLLELYGNSIFEFGDREEKIVLEILKELEDGIVREIPEVIT